jgi:hypothetical protein
MQVDHGRGRNIRGDPEGKIGAAAPGVTRDDEGDGGDEEDDEDFSTLALF